MDPIYTGFSDYTKNPKIDDQTILLNIGQHPIVEPRFSFDMPSPYVSFMNVPVNPPDPDPDDFSPSFTLTTDSGSFAPATFLSQDGGTPDPPSDGSPIKGGSSLSDDSDSSDAVFKYISQMLMEENMESKPSMFYDPLVLKATEKSLYEVLGEQYPSSFDSPKPLLGSVNDDGGYISTSTSTSTGKHDSLWISNVGDLNPALSEPALPGDFNFQSNSQPNLQFSANNMNDMPDIRNDGIMGSSVSNMVQAMIGDGESMVQFNRGLEQANKFVPQHVIDLENNTFAMGRKEEVSTVVAKEDKVEKKSSPNGSRLKKHHERQGAGVEEGRSNKQSAVYNKDSELSEVFDKVLLWPGIAGGKASSCNKHETEEDRVSKTSQPDERVNRKNGGKGRSKKQKKKETVDLRTLLMLCAQAISANDFRTANELLKQIRQHSSAIGDGSQRMAHFFANGLEARLAGTGVGAQVFFTMIASKRMTAADILKAYNTYLHACPFMKLSIFFAGKMILNAAEKAETLHIIDFGILYGFHWPILIQKLAERTNGPPNLRITGIEFPQRGFRPSERIDETGDRLARYCKQFNIPFEYNGIAVQNWETIQIEDLKIKRNEVLAVNCLGRFKNLIEDTVDADCPRDAVLNLIRKMNPDIFVHCICNGSYTAPFFATRFREALFHYSSLFDMLDATLPREDPERFMIESEIFGREAMNAIACEGEGRVERPETYKQWQVRTLRAGFKPLPLNQWLMKMLRDKLKEWYHKDFLIDEDGEWMLQGWKGRIHHASSCWVPA